MLDIPAQKYRPVRTGDGAGGYTTELGAATTIWADVLYHQNNIWRVLVLAEEDIKINDILALPHG